jgi:hypothetical protein
MSQVAALGGAAGTGLIAAASCDSNTDTAATPLSSIVVVNDAAQPQPQPRATAAPVVTAEGGAPDARSDASDVAPATAPCDSFAPLLCNFDGTCYPLSGLGFGGSGSSDIVADGGPDGSAAFRGFTIDDAGGGTAFFSMPYHAFSSDGPDPAITGCRVTCEANVRIDQGASLTAAVVSPNRDSFRFGFREGVWVETNGADASALSAPVTAGWSHLAVVLAPTVGGGATSQITLTAADASTVTTLPISDYGESMKFGVTTPTGSAPVVVFVDDVICQVTP